MNELAYFIGWGILGLFAFFLIHLAVVKITGEPDDVIKLMMYLSPPAAIAILISIFI